MEKSVKRKTDLVPPTIIRNHENVGYLGLRRFRGGMGKKSLNCKTDLVPRLDFAI